MRFRGRERRELVEAARAWGYFRGAIKARRDLWLGKRILDVGMGGGPHAVAFMELGARGYVGVDPHVGSDRVRDFRSREDPSIPEYHAFPYSAAEIMRLYPGVHLYSGLVEELTPALAAHRVDVAILGAVSEHLRDPIAVFRAVFERLDAGGLLWFVHCPYTSWTGHHAQPRRIERWDRSDPTQNAVVDWQHLDPAHPLYGDPTLNRIRTGDLRDLVEKYFEIIEWRESIYALDRLTPEIRERWRKYTLSELLTRNLYVTACRRREPLATDLSGRQLYQPDEGYLASADHRGEDLEPYRHLHSVYFGRDGALRSHSDNDHAGRRVFAGLRPGDRIRLRKAHAQLWLTVRDADADPPAGKLRVRERVPAFARRASPEQWTIAEVIRGGEAAPPSGAE
jgi:hypothetical protein